MNYHGPIGLNYPSVKPYIKVGHYHWAQDYNTWSAPTKTVLYRAPALILDTANRYSEADIGAFVQSK